MPYFGPLPDWYDKYEVPEGYDLLLDQDLEGFKDRVRRVLGIEYPGLPGTGKVWDYRPALGLLYAEEIKSYDFWGHTDFDCVYGDVDLWMTDQLLSKNMVISNHHSYVNGCWTLYRNCQEVNELFMRFGNWKEKMIHPEPNGWCEMEYSRTLEQSGLPYIYTYYQGNPHTTQPNLKKIGKKLYQDGQEIMQFHFRHSKRFPL